MSLNFSKHSTVIWCSIYLLVLHIYFHYIRTCISSMNFNRIHWACLSNKKKPKFISLVVFLWKMFILERLKLCQILFLVNEFRKKNPTFIVAQIENKLLTQIFGGCRVEHWLVLGGFMNKIVKLVKISII
jgi:hypothetical protein